jgi:Tfp pilus assembly protein PilF
MRALGLVTLLALLAACSTPEAQKFRQDFSQLFSSGKGQPLLATGLRQYEDGRYPESARSLQGALDKGLSDKDKVTAHKHLAFIHCSLNRERQCREDFGKALAIDPSFQLAPAEAGNPVWGPVFKSVKTGR